VRDRYNNPVSGVNVTVTTLDDSTRDLTTDSEGRVSTNLSPASDGEVEAEIDDCSTGHCTASIDANVLSTGINPSDHVMLVDSNYTTDTFLETAFGLDSDEGATALTFRTSGETEFSPDQMRVSHYHAQPQDGWFEDRSMPGPDLNATIADEDFAGDGSITGDEQMTMNVGGDYTDVSELNNVSAGGGEEVYQLIFWTGCDNPWVCGDGPDVYAREDGDFFVFEMIWKDDEGRTTSSTYIGSPRETS
jgi:hypothetical protein